MFGFAKLEFTGEFAFRGFLVLWLLFTLEFVVETLNLVDCCSEQNSSLHIFGLS
jgi:hypothetical protein